MTYLGFPQWLNGKKFACQAGDVGLIPVSARSPGGGNGNPFQFSCLGNSMDRGAWRATVHGVAKSQNTTEQLNHHHNHLYSWQYFPGKH